MSLNEKITSVWKRHVSLTQLFFFFFNNKIGLTSNSLVHQTKWNWRSQIHESRMNQVLHFNCLEFYIYIPSFTHLASLIHLSALAYAHKVAIFLFHGCIFFWIIITFEKKIVEHFGISTVYVNTIFLGV